MGGLRLLFSQVSRHGLSKTRHHSSPFITLQRSLCSSTAPQNDESSVPNRIEVVSYHAKPKDKSNAPNENEQQPPPPQSEPQAGRPLRDSPAQEARTAWSREDIRYVKDSPSITPVSYPTRVAPLPEDRAAGEGEKESEETETERRKIESENRILNRNMSRSAEDEKKLVPFPLLIKAESKKKESNPVLDLMDAIKQVKANAKAKFDETMEAHVRLAIPPRKTELIVRGTMNLPHGAKKAVRVAYFAEGADADEARSAGADVVGGLELIEEIASSGKIDIDKCFATRQLMPRLFKISKILNHRGLMPNPKQGTVTNDIARAVHEAKQGHVKFKMDNTSNVHVGLGKLSLKEELLRENVGAFVNSLLLAKPAGLKKTSKFAGYVNAFHICSTLGPAYPVSIQSLSRALEQYNKAHLA
ncbi:hypothetical protein Dsin_031259 [Dipteronia sinensis]|uniref:Large ribosomal subunit protein uL1c n=1 Tax=Dipteronia sinensis TaxID=43782 RepID=A0AAD9ZLK8_9ROSI|nr:hypothetical protein Dsin_031259 [Dipteronia sinensis]